MSKKCYICGKGPYLKSIARSHSHRGKIVRKRINIQKVKIKGKVREVCTSCIKKGKTVQFIENVKLKVQSEK